MEKIFAHIFFWGFLAYTLYDLFASVKKNSSGKSDGSKSNSGSSGKANLSGGIYVDPAKKDEAMYWLRTTGVDYEDNGSYIGVDPEQLGSVSGMLDHVDVENKW